VPALMERAAALYGLPVPEISVSQDAIPRDRTAAERARRYRERQAGRHAQMTRVFSFMLTKVRAATPRGYRACCGGIGKKG